MIATQTSQDFETARIRHHHIEHGEKGRRISNAFKRFPAVMDHLHLEPKLLEADLYEAGNGRLVFSDQGSRSNQETCTD